MVSRASWASYQRELYIELQKLHVRMYRMQEERLDDDAQEEVHPSLWTRLAILRLRRLQDVCNLCDIHRTVLGRGEDPTGVIGHPEILGAA